MINAQQLPLTEIEIWIFQCVWRNVPLKRQWLALVTRPTTINLLDPMLANIVRQVGGRLQGMGRFSRGVSTSFGMLAPFVKTTAALSMAAGTANVGKRKVMADTLLVPGQVSDVESRRVRLPRDQWQR